jgi:hypothetical protein
MARFERKKLLISIMLNTWNFINLLAMDFGLIKHALWIIKQFGCRI